MWTDTHAHLDKLKNPEPARVSLFYGLERCIFEE